MLPSTNCKIDAARGFDDPTEDWVNPIHQTKVPGRFSASIWATFRVWSAGIPDTRSTSSGVQFSASMPHTRCSMYSLASQPFASTSRTSPIKKPMSEPGRILTYSSACAAVRVNRGSTTINFDPSSLALSTCNIETGCASAGFPPMMIMDLELRISLNVFVMAP